MQVHLPIAACLVRSNADDNLNLCVHQVVPESRRSIREFVQRSCASMGAAGGTLLHHVLFFTPLSYAECQSAVRRFVAHEARARVVGRSRVLVGDESEIARAMTELSLDSTSLDAHLCRGRACTSRRQEREDYADDRSDGSRGSLSSFIVDDDDDDEEEEEQSSTSTSTSGSSSEDDPDRLDEEDMGREDLRPLRRFVRGRAG